HRDRGTGDRGPIAAAHPAAQHRDPPYVDRRGIDTGLDRLVAGVEEARAGATVTGSGGKFGSPPPKGNVALTVWTWNPNEMVSGAPVGHESALQTSGLRASLRLWLLVNSWSDIAQSFGALSKTCMIWAPAPVQLQPGGLRPSTGQSRSMMTAS